MIWLTRVKLIFQYERYKGSADVNYDKNVSSIVYDPELIRVVAKAKYSDLDLSFLDNEKKFKIRLHDAIGNNIYYLGRNNGKVFNHLIKSIEEIS